MLRQLSPRLDVHTRLLSAPGQPSPQNIYTVDEDEDLEIHCPPVDVITPAYAIKNQFKAP